MRSGSVTLRSPHQQRCCCGDSCSVSVAIGHICHGNYPILPKLHTGAHRCGNHGAVLAPVLAQEHRAPTLELRGCATGRKSVTRSCFCVFYRTFVSMWDGLPRPARVCSRLTVDCVCFLSTGMAAAVRLPAFCRPQNVSAALGSSHAVCYRCHAAPLRSQCHGDAGQQHHRVSHVHFRRFEGAARELLRPRGFTVRNA